MNTVLVFEGDDAPTVIVIEDRKPTVVFAIEQGPSGPPGPTGTTNLDGFDDLSLIFEGTLL